MINWFRIEFTTWNDPKNILMKILSCVLVFIILRTVVYFYDKEQKKGSK